MIYEFKCSSKKTMKKYEAFIKSNFYIDIVYKVLHDYDLNIFIRVSVFNESYSNIENFMMFQRKTLLKIMLIPWKVLFCIYSKGIKS